MTTPMQEAINASQHRRSELDRRYATLLTSMQAQLAQIAQDGVHWQVQHRGIRDRYKAYKEEIEAVEEMMAQVMSNVRTSVQEWMLEDPGR